MNSEMNKSEQKRRFYLILLCSLLVGICIVILTFFLRSNEHSTKKSDTSLVKKENVKGGIGTGSKIYNEKLAELDKNQADKALSTGESYISIPTIKKSPLVTKKEEEIKTIKQPKIHKKQNSKTNYDYKKEFGERIKGMIKDIEEMERSLSSSMSGGNIIYVAEKNNNTQPQFNQLKYSQDVKQSSEQSSNQTEFKSLRAGNILYAIIDTGINSDVPTPVLATVAVGKYRDARLLGKFNRFEEKLVLTFNKIILPCGRNIQITAYAINPATTEGSVASKVDTHFFSRWGGLIAASFLEGLGEVKKMSGAQSRLNSFNEDTNTIIYKEYDTSEQAWIAAGKIGKKASDIFAKNFNRPPTVYLNTGEEIGVLIMDITEK